MIDLSMDDVSQGLHVALGAIFVILPAAWGIQHAQIWGTGIGIVYAGIKEFIFDIHFEDEATSGGYLGGLLDFSFYLVGILAANLLLLF